MLLTSHTCAQILSQTKNPLSVQPHLRKCFEAIESLDFTPDLEIVAMNSKEKEKVRARILNNYAVIYSGLTALSISGKKRDVISNHRHCKV
jgi:hypothetical protein